MNYQRLFFCPNFLQSTFNYINFYSFCPLLPLFCPPKKYVFCPDPQSRILIKGSLQKEKSDELVLVFLSHLYPPPMVLFFVFSFSFRFFVFPFANKKHLQAMQNYKHSIAFFK
uniref:Transmembrane protein n=1 Tax=Siphoviridae sp. ctnR613 TaxID=2827939 RepID=A0A8S5SNU7_9CAUD|nr:MAG TPA: hypothetical protein [Siphoviridae sp. ctnR613]